MVFCTAAARAKAHGVHKRGNRAEKGGEEEGKEKGKEELLGGKDKVS